MDFPHTLRVSRKDHPFDIEPGMTYPLGGMSGEWSTIGWGRLQLRVAGDW